MNIHSIIRCSRCLRRKSDIFQRNIRTIECCRYKQTVASNIDEVVIPQRIDRSPTDILEALASTVSRDFTAAHYKFLDDPYLMPKNSLEVRSYSLSKESGRKAARYFLDNFPDLFYRDPAEPKVPAFSFKELYDENTDINEDDLNERIRENDISNSIIAYNNLKSKGCALSAKTTQSLLELVCFFNSSDPKDKSFTEEYWFENKKNFESLRCYWKDSDFAEKLFNEIEDKSAMTFATLLLGYTKYFQSQKAFKLYDEMVAQNIPVTLDAYNGLIENIVGIKESGESRFELIAQLLQEMNKNKVRPNVNTFNACLFVLSHSAHWRKSGSSAMQLITEMKRLKIRPSLASYFFLLTVLTRKKSESNVLYDIINDLEGKPFSIKHRNDVNFLEIAMDVCCNQLGDLDLGYRIHNLLSIGDNHKFFDGAQAESSYYRHFFTLLCLCESSDNLFEVYNKYVPNVYQPEPSIFLKMLNNIELHEAYSYIPQLYSDIVTFMHLFRANIAQILISTLSKKQEDSALQLQFVQIAWNVFQSFIERSKQAHLVPIPLTSELCDGLLKVFINGEDVEKANSIVKYMEEKYKSDTLIPSSNIIIDFCRLSTRKNRIDVVMNCIAFCRIVGLEEVIKDVIDNKKDYNLSDELLKNMKLIEMSNEEIKEKSNENETSSDSSSESSDSSSEE